MSLKCVGKMQKRLSYKHSTVENFTNYISDTATKVLLEKNVLFIHEGFT